MIEIGKKNNLRALRNTTAGMYLTDGKGNEVLLPNKYVPKSFAIGELIEVFIYKDSEDRITATTLVPLIELGGFAFLKVNQVTAFGAFLDWGMEKDLLVPIKEQKERMEEGEFYVVSMYLDETSDRLVASSKIKKFLDNEDIALQVGESVQAVIFEDTPLGYLAIVNGKHKGLLYHNEVFERLRMGDEITAYVKKVKEGGDLDLSKQKIGFSHVNDQTDVLLNLIKKSGGFLPLHDNSSPEEIQFKLKMSKKVFKKAVGMLYKMKKISISNEGISLVRQPNERRKD
jgi:predicted RNA-binding protein (virulence factor B family)